MTINENKDTHTIKRKRSWRIPFESRKPRERSACPNCNSILVKKRHRTKDYVCEVCNWEGVTVKKVMW